MTKPFIAAIAFALTACGSADRPAAVPTAEPTAEPQPAPVDAKLAAIDAFVAGEADKLAIPGMAVGIVRDGKLVSVKGYGTSAAARAIDGDTVFRLGSLTKVFTTTAVLHLRDRGKLSLDDAVAKHLPELSAVLSPPGKPAVQVRHLLQHNSGVPTLGDGSLDWTQGAPISEAQLLASVANAKLNFDPGSKSEYSNVGMALAGLVVARASATSYRAYIGANILAPLHMTMTRWDRDGFAPAKVFPGYLRDGKGFKLPESYWVLGAIEPAGGLYSTVADVARFLAFHADPDSAPNVLTRASTEESHTRAETPVGNPMGLGWVVGEDSDLGNIIWHNGATYSYGAWAGFDPARRSAAVVFVSTGDLAVVVAAQRIGMDALRLAAGFEPKYTQQPIAKLEPTPAELVAEIGERVRVLINAPAAAVYEELFSPAFLSRVSADEMRKIGASVGPQLGECSKHELVEDAGGGQFTVKLYCAKANLNVSVMVQLAPPHLFEGMGLQPASE